VNKVETAQMNYPAHVLRLAAALLRELSLEHAVATLRLRGELLGGCCGVLAPDYTSAAALKELAARLESCGERETAARAVEAMLENSR
jgi:hypothetical protein